MGRARHVHQVARRDRQLSGQACAFGTDRVLGHLHHQALAFVHQCADALDRRAFAQGNFRRMNERGTVQADIDECRLHSRQYPHDFAFIDVADDPALLRTLDVDLLQDTVFDHRHARLHRRDVDQNLFTHGRVSFRHVHDNGRICSERCLVCVPGLPTGYAEMAEQFRGFAKR
ncbi:hypothetical protein D9M71_390280 [compost metagenome]